jgi:hypothetical protein
LKELARCTRNISYFDNKSSCAIVVIMRSFEKIRRLNAFVFSAALTASVARRLRPNCKQPKPVSARRLQN